MLLGGIVINRVCVGGCRCGVFGWEVDDFCGLFEGLDWENG